MKCERLSEWERGGDDKEKKMIGKEKEVWEFFLVAQIEYNFDRIGTQILGMF